MNLVPDGLSQLQHCSAGRRRQIEVLVLSRRMFDTQPDALRQIAAIGVVTNLASAAEYMQRLLPLEHLLHQVWHNVGHRQLNVAAHDIAIVQRALLANSHAVKWPGYREWQLILLPGPLREIFGGQLLEAVGRTRWRATSLHP